MLMNNARAVNAINSVSLVMLQMKYSLSQSFQQNIQNTNAMGVLAKNNRTVSQITVLIMYAHH